MKGKGKKRMSGSDKAGKRTPPPVSVPDIDLEFQRALLFHQSGQLNRAEEMYRSIVRVNPSHAGALHLLGVIALQRGDYGGAVELIQRAIGNDPSSPFYFNNLAAAFRGQGKLNDAIDSYKRAVEIDPRYAEGYYNMSSILHDQGNFVEAVSCCRKALEIKPDYFQACYNMGNSLHAEGDLDGALSCFCQALRIEPSLFQAYNNMGNIYRAQGRLEDAIGCYRKGIQLNPRMVEGYVNLASVLREAGDLEEALACYHRAVALRPQYVEALCGMGILFSEKGDYGRALSCYHKILEISPDHFEAYNLMGIAYKKRGALDEAISCYRRSLDINPQYADAAYNLGIACKDGGDFDGAILSYQKALNIRPDYAEAYNNMGIVYQSQGKLDLAISCYEKALDINPDLPEAYNSMGNAYQDQGGLDEAMFCYREALTVRPDYASAHSNLLFSLLHRGSIDPVRVSSEHKEWARRHAASLATAIRPHLNDISPDRPIRIGYVSPDFRLHSVAYFVEPLLSGHDRSQFEIFCYSDVSVADSTTDRLRGMADCWRDVFTMPDIQLAEQVRKDGIDILVDLAGHTSRNRLLMFAQKPAPLQVTYIGYPHTTGLATMDYRITDSLADPDGMTDHLYTEKLIRLPRSFLCYRPPEDAPEVSVVPFEEKGFITFGSFNNRSKITMETVALWSRILDAVPGSRLVLKSRSFQDIGTQDLLREQFSERGLSSGRIRFHGYSASTYEHLELYSEIDIGLDTIPYNGTTTTCEALWMGVPVVVLAGKSHASRVGVSLLTNIGLTDLVALSIDDYCAKVAELAGDRERLVGIRKSLRSMMAASPMMDARGHAGSLESAYRRMWHRWCGEASACSSDRRKSFTEDYIWKSGSSQIHTRI